MLTVTYLAIGALLILAAGAGLLLYAVKRKGSAPEQPDDQTDGTDQQAQRPIWRPGQK